MISSDFDKEEDFIIISEKEIYAQMRGNTFFV